ncbi:MAG: tyrosine-type recombinase/integrase [Gaiellaceae bacterium]
MGKYTGVDDYMLKKGKRFRWKAEVNGRTGKRAGYMHEKDAAEARAAWVAEAMQGAGLGGRGKTLGAFWEGDYVPRRRAKVARGELRSSTVTQNERDGRLHILPALGKRRLQDITVEDVERFCDRLTAAEQSSDSVLRIRNTLGTAMKLARKWKLISFNPVTDSERPRPRRRTPTLPTLRQLESMADLAPTSTVRALVLVAAFTGIRKSEAFGLRWEDVDLSDGAERIIVRRQFYKGELVERAKSEAGNREIVLAPQAAAILRELSVGQQLDDRPNRHGLVFPSPMGVYWLDSNFDRRVWQPLREAAGLPDLKFHTLRYFYVSHVRAQGLPGAITEQLTGHTDERTHRLYTRPIAGMEPYIRAELGKAFEGGERG